MLKKTGSGSEKRFGGAPSLSCLKEYSLKSKSDGLWLYDIKCLPLLITGVRITTAARAHWRVNIFSFLALEETTDTFLGEQSLIL